MTSYGIDGVPSSLVAKLAAVRAVILDIDGVLTDGRMWLSESGEEFLAFHVRDGYGLKQLLAAGIAVGVISGRNSKAARTRLEALGVRYVYQGRDDKIPAFETFLDAAGVKADETLYVGDDTLDLPVMRRVGVAVTVADAHPKVQAFCAWVTSLPGGRGAVREVADGLVAARSGP